MRLADVGSSTCQLRDAAMSLDHPHQLIAAFIAVATILLALWIEGGLVAALSGAALIDLGISLFGRHRRRVVAVRNDRPNA